MSPREKKRKTNGKRPKSTGAFARRLVSFLVLVISFGVGGFIALVTIVSRDLPTLNSLADYAPPMVNRVFDADGNLVAEIFDQRRTVFPVERIPAHTKNAFLAAEDAQFYNHEGLDYQAIMAALVNEMKRKIFGGARRGGSTITQQTAKTFLLSPEQTYVRKLKDMILAMRIEEALTKEEILHLYLNQIYFGNGAYGVEEAARTYYGVSASKLTLGQSAVLASIPKSPNRINPFVNVERVRSRREYVLEQMVKHRFVTAGEASEAKKEKIRIEVKKPPYLGTGSFYTEEIRRMLVEKWGQERVSQGGLTIYTAMNSEFQNAAERALKQGLRDVDKRQGYRGPLVRLDPDETKHWIDLLQAVRNDLFPREEEKSPPPEKGGKSIPIWDLSLLSSQIIRNDIDGALKTISLTVAEKGLIVGGLVKRIDSVKKNAVIDLGSIDGVLSFSTAGWARPFSPEETTPRPKQIGDVLQKGDVILVRVLALHHRKKNLRKNQKAWVDVALEQAPLVEGALVAVDPHSHRVRTIVGGYDFARSSFNRATQAKRQPGSGFKPFIYALGIESKRFTPVGYFEEGRSRLITDAPKVFFDPWRGTKWAPRNSGNKYRGDITLRTCLTHSVNTCSISLLEKIGIAAVHGLSSQLQLIIPGTPFPKNLTLALGTGEVYPIQLVNAYSIFPNGGTWAPPVMLEKVKDINGTVLYEHKEESIRALSPQTAYIMSDLMKSVVEHGTGKRAKALKRNVAGKTGTTNQARSVWFTGFTPSIVAGAYVGFDDNRPLGKTEYGGKAALPIWLQFMKTATAKQADLDFEVPDGIDIVTIDKKTGLLLASAHPTEELASDDHAPSEAENENGDALAEGSAEGSAEALDKKRATGFKPPSLSDLISKVARAITNADAASPQAMEKGPDAPEKAPDSPDTAPMTDTKEAPPSAQKPAALPPGAYEEVFIEGTAPTQMAEDEAPPPLELFELSGGLGP